MQPQREADGPITMYDLAYQNRQNRLNPALSTVEATPVVGISGITGYRLLGLLLAIAGLVKTILSVEGVSAPLKKVDLVVAGVFGIIYLCLGWAESSTRRFWSCFFRVELSPIMIRGVRIICRGAVNFAYILFASLQVYIWVCLFLWPFLPIAFIVDSRVSEPTSLDALRFGIIMLVSTTITILQSVAFFSVMDWLRQFPWGERCVNHLNRYFQFCLETLFSSVAAAAICALLVISPVIVTFL